MEIVLISPVCPFDPRDGHRLAVLSDVHALLDNRIDLGLIAFTYQGESDSMPNLCPTVKIQARKGGFAARFSRSLWKNLPPTAERLYSAQARATLRSALREWNPRIVIVDDASVSGYISDIRQVLPNVKVVLRSHNVMHDVRTEQLNRAQGAAQAAIAFDRKKYIELERSALLASDRHWAITSSDADRMNELYHRPGQCLTVSVPFERYQTLQSDQGQSNGFAHVGSLDFRRRDDLSQFLDRSWPRILEADHMASLTLAGEMKGNPIPARNVSYAGRVASDADVYSRARFALNFQSSPGGVKLKTLTSLAAGRTLLSTREGVQGIDIKSGSEFFDIDRFLQRADLQSVLSDVRATQSVADAGRQYVATHHSRQAVARQVLNLIEGVWNSEDLPRT
jgi:hypothetical protein